MKLAISDTPIPHFTFIGKPTALQFVSIKYISSDLHNTLKKLASQPIAYFAIPPQTQVPLKNHTEERPYWMVDQVPICGPRHKIVPLEISNLRSVSTTMINLTTETHFKHFRSLSLVKQCKELLAIKFSNGTTFDYYDPEAVRGSVSP